LDGFVGCHLQRKEVDEGDTTAVDWSRRMFLLCFLLNILVELVGVTHNMFFFSLFHTDAFVETIGAI
jgi:hypothetical protein